MSISILIPAFRPTFLRQAIASALTQGTDDFEILVSDDSGGEALLPVVESFRDPRIHYLRTPGRVGAGENCRLLWQRCDRDVMMFLFDDDLLLPHALAELSAGLEAHPEASFCYGRRYTIDDKGRITREPPANAPLAVIGGEHLATAVVGQVINHIGELSNVLINRALGLTADDLLSYFGVDLHVVADVAFYLNASRRGPAVAVGKPVAAFRRHDAQNSSPAFNPRFAIGIVEWELFVRGEYDAGRLPQTQALQAVDKLAGAYSNWAKTQPPISMMQPGLQRLRERIAGGETGVLDDSFRADWDRFVERVLNPTTAAPSYPATT